MAYQRTGFWIGALLVSTHSIFASASQQAETPAEMLTKGSAQVDLRYRYEYVDQDGVPENAHASTLRSRLTLLSARYDRISAGVEFDHVGRIGAARYRTPTNGKTRYPIVADPDGFDLNQAWIRYHGGDGDLTVGRQRILHGSQRFVGGVGWRQNEQTFDAVRWQSTGDDRWSLDYSYIWDVNRIFGPDTPTPANLQRRFDSDSHALYAGYRIDDNHKVGFYGYLLDFSNNAFFSSQTYGLDYSGKLGIVGLQASVARQSDYRGNGTDYEADYYFAEASVPVGGVTLAAGREVLGSDDGAASFMTPLATGHKFQGWSDVFLVTPAAGVEDDYLKVAGSLGPVKLAGFYHQYAAEDGPVDYGTEFNAVATLPINKNWMAQLKYANFQADADAPALTDFEKIWFTLNFKY